MIKKGKSSTFSINSNEIKDFTYYWPETINNVEVSLDTRLELGVLENFPYNSTIVGGKLRVYKEYCAKDYIVIRVYGDTSRTTGQPATPLDFSLMITESENVDLQDQYGWLLDALVVTIIFAGILTFSSILSYVVNRHMQRRRMNQIQLQDLNSHLYPTPELYSYQLQLNNLKAKNSVPISMEEFITLKTKFLAQNVLVVLPGAELYLKEGDLPKFEVGTRMLKLGPIIEEVVDKGKGQKGKSILDKIKGTRELTE